MNSNRSTAPGAEFSQLIAHIFYTESTTQLAMLETTVQALK